MEGSSGLTAQPLAAWRSLRQELLWFFGFESIDIGFPLRDDSKGLPYKFVGDRNDRHLAGLAVGPETVKTCLALGIAPERRERRYIKLASQG